MGTDGSDAIARAGAVHAIRHSLVGAHPTIRLLPLAGVAIASACAANEAPGAGQEAAVVRENRDTRATRSQAAFRVSARLPPGKQRGWVLLLERCEGSNSDRCEPAADVPVYEATCISSSSARSGCGSPEIMMPLGITGSDGLLQPRYLGAILENERHRIFVPKDPALEGYRDGGRDLLIRPIPDNQAHPAAVAHELAQIRKDAPLVRGLDQAGVVTLGADFTARDNAQHDAEFAAERADRNLLANDALATWIEQCRTRPDEKQCDDMMLEAQKNGVGEALRARAAGAFSEAQAPMDDARWQRASPECAAPTSSSSCDAVKAYLLRYGDGRHAADARKMLARAAPALESFARQENELRLERMRAAAEQRQRIYESCVGTCMAGGRSRSECDTSCR